VARRCGGGDEADGRARARDRGRRGGLRRRGRDFAGDGRAGTQEGGRGRLRRQRGSEEVCPTGRCVFMTSPQFPAVPERIKRLPELAMDLWWTWNTQAREV